MNYLVGDVIIRIKNAVMARQRSVVLPYSKMTIAITRLLAREGYTGEPKEEEKDKKKVIVVSLQYNKRMPYFTDVRIISKPSLRVYGKANDIQRVRGRGLGKNIISTSKGVMTGEEALEKGVGGEILFRVW